MINLIFLENGFWWRLARCWFLQHAKTFRLSYNELLNIGINYSHSRLHKRISFASRWNKITVCSFSSFSINDFSIEMFRLVLYSGFSFLQLKSTRNYAVGSCTHHMVFVEKISRDDEKPIKLRRRRRKCVTIWHTLTSLSCSTKRSLAFAFQLRLCRFNENKVSHWARQVNISACKHWKMFFNKKFFYK